MADLQRTVSIIFEGQDKVTVTTDGISKSFAAIGIEADTAEDKVAGLEKELAKTGDSAPAIDKASQALKALAASLVVKDFIDANLAYEQFAKTITVATGDATKAAEEFDYIRAVADRLGIQVRGTAEDYAKFAAATKGTALEGDGARVVFEAFAGTLSRVGASAVDIGGAFVQLQQGISKGKFELEDLKSIAERVPNFFISFADSLGVTTAELYDLISAGQIGSVEILKFANTLNENLQGADFDGYAASFARLRNAIDDTYLLLGNAGVFDILVDGLKAGAAGLVTVTAGLELAGVALGAFIGAISTGDFSELGNVVSAAFEKFGDSIGPAYDRLLGLNDAAKDVGFNAIEAGRALVDGLGKGEEGAENAKAATESLNAALKGVGLDPKKLAEPLADIEARFEALATNPAARGDQILAGLVATLKTIKDDNTLAAVAADVVTAFAAGKLTAEEFASATEMLDKAQDKLAGKLPPTTRETEKQSAAMERQARETAKAEEAAQKYALELEKLASNERIKNIEARVTINVAQIEADTKRIEALFESLNTSINST
ncbi:MAG: tape measure protein, partial [Burkholderiaceae bacterium]|nr:tape measure protein [Burkholderiaceae bacterium]